MRLAMWVLAFLVDGWELPANGFDIKAYWTQEKCQDAMPTERYGVFIEPSGKQYQGHYECIYEPEWNKWDRGVEREAKP